MAVGEFEASVESADVSLVSRVLKLKGAGAGIFYKQKLPYRQQRRIKRCSDDDSSKGGNSRYVGCVIRTQIRAQANEMISGVTTILFLGFEEAMRSDVAVRVAEAARGTYNAQQSHSTTRSIHTQQRSFDFEGALWNGSIPSLIN
jgi:hypothetical protein